MRLDVTLGLDPFEGSVVETESFVVATSLRNGGKSLGVDRDPGPDHRHDGRLQHLDSLADPRRENLFQLGQSPERRLLDAGDRSAGGGQQTHGDGDRLLIVEQ